MKYWKQVLALLLSGAMALSLFACNAAAKPTTGGSAPDASSEGGFWDLLGGLFGGGKESAPPSAEISGDPAASASPEIVADLSQPVLKFSAGVSPADALLTINGEQVPADLVLYWLNYTCYYFMSQYGVYGVSMADYQDQLLDDAVSICASEVLLRQRAAQLGCLPTDAQAEQARAQMEGDPDTLALFRESYGLTDQSIEYLFLADAYYENMLAAVTHEPSEEELMDYLSGKGMYRVKHILLKTVDDGRQPLPDDVVAQKKAQAEDFLSQLQKAEDMPALFDRLMNEHSEDGRDDDGALYAPDGYLAAPGQMVPEFEEAGQALKPGELSGIVETDYGYHILLGLSLAPLTGEEEAQYQQEYRPDALRDQAAQWQEEAEITRSDALSKLNVADFYARMTAYQQALEEKNAPAESGAVG